MRLGLQVNGHHDAASRPLRTTWARGAWREQSYDADGLLAATAYSDATPAVALTYDAFRRLAAASNAVAAYAYTNSDLGVATNETIVASGTTNLLVRLQDAFARPAGLKVGRSSPSEPSPYSIVGHSWGRYTIDDQARLDLIHQDYWGYLQEIGFFPADPADWGQILLGVSVPGDVRLGGAAVGAHWPTGWKEYPILFSSLSLALPQVKASDDSPPWYNLFNYNCTDYAIAIGEIVYVYTMDASGVSTPWVFSNWLNTH